MTRVEYEPCGFTLTVEGHAGAGVRGQDLVCAALSILTATLEAAVIEREEKLLPSIGKSPGRVRISCRPDPESVWLCRSLFETIFTGFELLGGSYPEHVQTIRTQE